MFKSILKKSLTLSLALSCTLSHAIQWNDDAVEQLNKKATQSFVRFLHKKKNNEVTELLGTEKSSQLLTSLLRQKSDHALKHFTNTIVSEAKEQDETDKYLAYFALDAKLQGTDEYALNFYEALVKQDKTAAPYVLPKLESIFSRYSKDNDHINYRRDRLKNRLTFKLMDISSSHNTELPEVCLRFSRKVRPKSVQNWQH